MNYKTQDNQILRYLQLGHKISQGEAVQLFACYRLSSVIHRLRNLGHQIITHREPNKSNKGNHARYEYKVVNNS